MPDHMSTPTLELLPTSLTLTPVVTALAKQSALVYILLQHI